jgi:hypothetical protein
MLESARRARSASSRALSRMVVRIGSGAVWLATALSSASRARAK